MIVFGLPVLSNKSPQAQSLEIMCIIISWFPLARNPAVAMPDTMFHGLSHSYSQVLSRAGTSLTVALGKVKHHFHGWLDSVPLCSSS